EGEVVQAGTPHELYDHPATPFAAAFLGSANVLRARVTGGQAHVGGAPMMEAPADLPDGANVQLFVRPHEVRLTAATSGQGEVSLAVVERLTRVGGFVKVELRLPTDEPMTVQMPRVEVDAMRLVVGGRVLVDLGEAKVFVEDY